MEIPSWLTKEFLEEVLRKNCNDSQITVDNFDVRVTTTKGDNYASIIHRVAVSYHDGKGSHTKNFIVKSFPESKLTQSFLKDMHFFDKEISAYSKLLPAMRSLSELPIVSPRYYATDRPDTVILEDLTPRGFKMADRKKRLDLDHSFLALKALARFHGLSYAVVQRDPTIIHHFPESTTSERVAAMEAVQEDDMPSWLSKECLTEILRRGEDDPELTVVDLDVRPATAKGDNYASTILRVVATCVDGRRERTRRPLIVKALPANEALQRLLKEGRLFDKEIYTYSRLLPEMRHLVGDDAMITAPKFYPSDRCDALFLEDLSVRGFKMADRRKRLDFEHSLLVLETLARFHGLSFAVVQRDPSVVDHFPESTFSDRMREFNSRFMPPVFRSLASVIARWPGYERFSEKILASIDSLLDDVQEMIAPKQSGFNVLNHGDFWVSNVLFRYGEDAKKIEEVCLLDYQIIRYGSPALDLQCFLASSLQDGVREDHEEELMAAYHRSLADTLRSVGLEPGIYDLEDLKRECEEKAPFGFYMGCFYLAATVADSSEAYDMHVLTEESIKEGTANPMEKAFNGKNYREVLQKHLMYYEQKGMV